MDQTAFSKHSPGHLEPTTFGESFVRNGLRDYRTAQGQGFVPDPLPAALNPATTLFDLLECLLEAERNLSLLEGTARQLINPQLLAGVFKQREAIRSSKIEDTIASAEDLALIDRSTSQVANPSAAREVLNYIRALDLGLNSDLPISLRLLREMHATLLQGVRCAPGVSPGNFRQAQNIIGGDGTLASARFVPPPTTHLDACLNDLERYIHTPDSPWPPLVRFAFIHYQFEAIHPFGDGNGRLGRLLISLMLCQQAQLSKPLVYVSAYFEAHRDQYYDLLYRVSTRGEWVPWIRFFLEAIATQSQDATRRAEALLTLCDRYLQTVQKKRASPLLARLVNRLFVNPAVTVVETAQAMECSNQNASNLIRHLEAERILSEVTGRSRDRVWVARDILHLINE